MKELTFTVLFIIQSFVIFGQTDNYNVTLSITEITEHTFNNGGTTAEPNVDYSLVKKEDGQIKIPNLNSSGSIVTFKDDPRIEEKRVTNEYLGFYHSIKKHLIRTIYYEGVKYVLIGNYNDDTQIWNIPIFSSDFKYFLAYKSNGLEGEPTGLQIWEVVKNEYSPEDLEIRKIFELNQLLFDPTETKWDSDNSILIKGQVIENHWYPTKNSEVKYWRLRFN
jgi:hypothetical protein